MWTGNFRLIRDGLSDGIDVINCSEVIRDMTIDCLPETRSIGISLNSSLNNKEVGSRRFMAEDWSTDQVVMNDLSRSSPIYVAEEEWLRIAHIQD